ncbi:MAG: fibronectin type III domain-containing protein [Eubacterium sp.]|nr:fibronectin type III domain-containing protein [Eubacterium sp.]
MKRVISLVLSVIILISSFVICNFSAFSEEWSIKCGDNLTYTYNKSAKEIIISGKGKMYSYKRYEGYDNGYIPPWIDEILEAKKITIKEGVTSIGNHAFDPPWGWYDFYETDDSNREQNSKVISLPSTLTTIGDSAFHGLDIKSINLPAKLKKIGKYCFSYSSLRSIKIPKNVETIPKSCFDECHNLKTVTISNGVKKFSSDSFEGTSITSLSIPASVTFISSETFGLNSYNSDFKSKIKSISINKSNKNYSSYSGAIYNKSKSKLIYYPRAKKELKLAKGVKTIGKMAFNGSCLKSIKLPKTVTSLGEAAFYGSSITQISIPGKVKVIPKRCFQECGKLKNVKIPNSVTSIEEHAFFATFVNSLDIPNSVTKINDACISFSSDKNGKMGGMTIPSSVKTIKNRAIGFWDYGYYATDYIAGYKGSAAEKYAKKEGIKFIVAPTKGSLSSVSSPKKGNMKLKWKKVSNAAGYQIQISTSSTMSEKTRSYTVKKGSTTSANISKLTKGKKYYVQVRAYKKVKVNGKTRTVYGSWSEIKSVKVKK